MKRVIALGFFDGVSFASQTSQFYLMYRAASRPPRHRRGSPELA